MFKKHKRLVMAIILGVIVLCIGGKLGMDYKKDYDWQQEKNRQIEVARYIKKNYGNVTEIKFERKGAGGDESGYISYNPTITQDGSLYWLRVEYNPINPNNKDKELDYINADYGGVGNSSEAKRDNEKIAQLSNMPRSKSTQTVKVIFSDDSVGEI